MTEGIYLLLGSNLGNRRQQLAAAVDNISKHYCVIRKSAIYQTTAWGDTDQPSFYNQAIQINASCAPVALLDDLLTIERQMGRVRKAKWEQRVMDIDMLYYNDLVMTTDRLIVPHPQIQYRRFALVPLVGIAGEFVHPVLKTTQQELLRLCTDRCTVTLLS